MRALAAWELLLGSAFLRQELIGIGSAMVVLTLLLAAALLRARTLRRRVLVD